MAASDVLLTTPINIPLERSLYVGNVFRGILYGEVSPKPNNFARILYRLIQLAPGLEIFTFFAAVYCISHRPSDYRKGQRFYMAYGGILLVLVTIDVALDFLWGQYMWIDHRNHPGGPPGFFVASQFSWYSVMQVALSVMENILGDGLLVCHTFP
jgi:hypothetical protein